MKIQIVSDLHLEFSDINIKNESNADVLILSGDIFVAEDLYDYPSPDPYTPPGAMASFGHRVQSAIRYRDFFKRVSFQFPHVVIVAGNHEFYHGKFYRTLKFMREYFATNFANIYFLERDVKIIDNVVFVGGTLWTDMNKGDPITLHAVRDMMMDYKRIRNDEKGFTALKPVDTALRHRETKKYIQHIVSEHKDSKVVVVGHHSPSYLSVHEQYRNEYLMNGAYHSDLSELILDNPQIRLWCHGHTHHHFDYMIGETRIVCNPRGYENDTYKEQTDWNPNFIVEV